jgi:hypothetical protein
MFPKHAYQEEDIFQGYSGKSIRKLISVSVKYDPEGVFQQVVPGGSKLPKFDDAE